MNTKHNVLYANLLEYMAKFHIVSSLFYSWNLVTVFQINAHKLVSHQRNNFQEKIMGRRYADFTKCFPIQVFLLTIRNSRSVGRRATAVDVAPPPPPTPNPISCDRGTVFGEEDGALNILSTGKILPRELRTFLLLWHVRILLQMRTR
jgi:hypothetical protein